MRYILLVLMSCFLISPAIAEEYDHAEWHTCTVDNDCILTHSPCGILISVNKYHLTVYDNYVGKVIMYTDCEHQALSDDPHAVEKCVNKLCAVGSTIPH